MPAVTSPTLSCKLPLGELLWGDLYQPARRLYFENFQAFFLGPAHNNLLQFLLALPATPIAPPTAPFASVYDALKAYLMTTSEAARADGNFLVPVMLRWWSLGLTATAERDQAAQRQFQFYAAELLRDDPYPSDSDAAAVGNARRYLGQFSAFDHVYALVLEDAGRHYPPVNFNRQYVGSEQALTDSYEVPGAYTKAGWDFVHGAISQPGSYLAGESWVVGPGVIGANSASGGGDAKLAADLSARYQAGFVEAWRQYLLSAALKPFTSLRDAAQKLKLLGGNNQALTWNGTEWTPQNKPGAFPSPIDHWLSLAALNTAVDVPAVAAIFQPVAAAHAGSQRYRDLLTSLSASLASASSQDAASLAIAQAALQAAKQIEGTFRKDADSRVGAMVARILEEPIDATRTVLRGGGGPAAGPSSGDWNAKGADLYSRIKPVTGKYPFTPAAAQQAGAQEIASIFRPKDGALWKFYDVFRQKLIARDGPHFVVNPATGLSLNPAFLAFLEHAAAFGDAAFAGGAAQPKFRYTLRPVLSADVDLVKLSIDGQSATFQGNAAAKVFIWTGTGAQEMHLNVKFKNKTEYNWDKTSTPWAVLMFFDGATRRQGTQIEVPLRPRTPATSMVFEVTATPPIFDPGYFSALAGVADVLNR